MPTLNELHQEFMVRPIDGKVVMAGYDPAATPFEDDEDDAEEAVEEEWADPLFDKHELMFAEKKRSVLLILQGLDCSGKNGTIKHVIIHMNPAGVRTASFIEPTEIERDHHFLWRYRQALPQPGELGVFDRSHYEDVLVPRVMEDLPDDEFHARLQEINEFEAEIAESGTLIIKCMLHISFDEQRERFLRRLRRDDKRWKFSEADMEARRHWDDFQRVYGEILAETSTDVAPWFVIPADHKWYRNWAIGALLMETFDSMGNAYPEPDFDIEDLRNRLQPPN